MILQPQKSLKQDLFTTLGDTGTERYAGYFTEEFNSQWRDEQRIDNVESMRRTDGTCKQLLNAIKAPILAAEEVLEPASDDPQDIEIRDFIYECLFNMPNRTWKEFLREALTYFDFGFSVFEQIYERRTDGKIYLKDLEPRIQHSILNWQMSDGRRGITQLVKTSEKPMQSLEVPLNKLLIFTNDKEGDDLTGQSILRASWKHFVNKDILYRIAGISAERYGVGIPMITKPDSVGEAEDEKAQELGRNIRSNEKAFIVRPSKEWDISILTPSGNPQQGQIDSLIQHHDRMILANALATFLNLGATSTGSFALSEDQSSFFLKHVEDKALYIAEQVIRQVIQRLVQLNYGKQARNPKFKFTQVGDFDLSDYASILNTLNTAGLIKKGPKMIQFVHKMFKLPEITEEEMIEMEQAELDKAFQAVEAETDEPAEEEEIAEGEDDMAMPEDEEELPEEEPEEEEI